MKNILKVGVPVALQDGFIQISFIAITIFANQRGLNDAAAVGIVEKIIGILFLVPSSMLSTISALASQNIGAGKHDRARLTLRYVLCMTVGYGLVAATIVQFVSVPFVGLFTNDGAVQILGGQYLRSYAWDCVFAGVHFCLSGYFMHMACLSYHLSTIPYLSYVPEFHCLIMRQRIFRIHYFRWDVRHRQDRSSQSLSVLAY